MFKLRIRELVLFLILPTSVILLVIYGIALPLQSFINLDGDSVAYMSHSFYYNSSVAYENYGIYRSVAIAVKSVILKLYDFSFNYYPASFLIALLARVAFLVSCIALLKLNKNSIVFLLAAATCNIFFIDTFTLLSRSLNDLIGCIVAVSFMWLASRVCISRYKMTLLVILFMLVGLVTYESYILFSFVIVFVTRKSERLYVFMGVVFGTYCIFLMNKYNIFLIHPKLSATSKDIIEGNLSLITYTFGKYLQLLVTISDVSYPALIKTFLFTLCLFFILSCASNKNNDDRNGEIFVSNKFSSGMYIFLGGLLPSIAAYFLGKIGPQSSKIQWLLLSGLVMMTAISFSIFSFKNRTLILFGNVCLSFFFGISVLLINQLSIDLALKNYCNIKDGLFRNISSLRISKVSDISCTN